MRAAVVFGVCAMLAVAAGQNEDLDMMGLINMLYLKADIDLDGSITEAELGKIYEYMDADSDGEISNTEFIQMWQNLTGQSAEMSNAYFFLADLDGSGKLDHLDNDAIYARFDLNGDGLVQANEFMQKYEEVYREVPFVLLFERVESANNNDQHLDKTEFEQLFSSFTSAADDSVTKADFEKEWTDGKFGSLQDADDVFASFDTDQNDVITSAEVGAKFDTLDTSGNSHLEILEAIKLADYKQS